MSLNGFENTFFFSFYNTIKLSYENSYNLILNNSIMYRYLLTLDNYAHKRQLNINAPISPNIP